MRGECGRVNAGGDGLIMKKYNSIEELMSSCSNSMLKSHVSSILAENKYIAWSLVSCAVEGDACRSEFKAPTENANLEYHLSCEMTSGGWRGHIHVTDLPRPEKE